MAVPSLKWSDKYATPGPPSPGGAACPRPPPDRLEEGVPAAFRQGLKETGLLPRDVPVPAAEPS
ncbi:hypothetical protein SHO565_68360 [Streptomyces sp. HO565]